jgi:hypothetical protein
MEAYSKRLDLADALVSAVRHLQQAHAQTNEPAHSVCSTWSHRQWRVGDRLSGADTEQLIAAFTAGTSKRMLAERYGISESSVKRLIRQHGASKLSCGLSGPVSSVGKPRRPRKLGHRLRAQASSDQTWASVRDISVQRPVGEAGTGKVADRFQHKASTARAAGSDPPFRIVKIGEEVEEGM